MELLGLGCGPAIPQPRIGLEGVVSQWEEAREETKPTAAPVSLRSFDALGVAPRACLQFSRFYDQSSSHSKACDLPSDPRCCQTSVDPIRPGAPHHERPPPAPSGALSTRRAPSPSAFCAKGLSRAGYPHERVVGVYYCPGRRQGCPRRALGAPMLPWSRLGPSGPPR